MSRTIPRAYVTAAWSKNRVDAENEAAVGENFDPATSTSAAKGGRGAGGGT